LQLDLETVACGSAITTKASQCALEQITLRDRNSSVDSGYVDDKILKSDDLNLQTHVPKLIQFGNAAFGTKPHVVRNWLPT